MRKLRFLTQQVYVLSSCDVQERLLRFLAGRYGKMTHYRIDLSKKDVAAAIATTPETLSRVIARMESDDVLRWQRNEIFLAADAWDGIEE
jgi:CRP-like cAMP-binding protein